MGRSRRSPTARAAAATPAVSHLAGAGVPFTEHRYVHDPAAKSYGLEAARALGVSAERVFKTLVLSLDGRGAQGRPSIGVAVLPVERRLDLKAAAAALGGKKAALADAAAASRATGYVMGGVSPFGQRTAWPTVVDAGALAHESVYVSGGARGFDVEVAPTDLVGLLGATTAPICRAEG